MLGYFARRVRDAEAAADLTAVWDGIGHITRATGVLRRYRGLAADIAGDTPVSAPENAQIELAAGNGGPRGDC
jgi:hypothetical protein